MMIDPPGGHRYGFPKPCDAPDGTPLDEWLLANGYPQSQIDAFPNGVPCRVWVVDDPE